MRVAVTGAGGQLGVDLIREIRRSAHEAVAWTRADLDVECPDQVRRALDAAQPELVVHAAAYTAVDRAEAEPERAYAVNDTGTANVARACARAVVPFIYVSTDYVFDGAKRSPYEPHDEPRPLNVYGASKLAGERRVQETDGDWLIVRTSWVYGAQGPNFVRTILGLARERDRLRVVDDQVGSPTWTVSLARTLVQLATTRARGVLHVTDRTLAPDGTVGISWHAFARAIVEEAGCDVRVERISTEDMPRPAVRPRYSVLDVRAAELVLGAPLPGWQSSLAAALREMGAGEPAFGRAVEARVS
ncbi:MAG: dTDP-4-dehydrorhamnose reductase [Gemmatimonadetes bacterium]|nr:dTDP-4-dehydrorhamnose reductase [Gemmatimonadota bacterium]